MASNENVKTTTVSKADGVWIVKASLIAYEGVTLAVGTSTHVGLPLTMSRQQAELAVQALTALLAETA